MSKEDINHLVEDLSDSVIEYERDGGWPSFLVCATRDKNGFIKELFFDPRQQKDNNIIYKYEVKRDLKNLRFCSWEHKGIEPPIVRYNGWCSDHNCTMTRVLAPRRTNLVRIIEYGVGVCLYFQQEDVFK